MIKKLFTHILSTKGGKGMKKVSVLVPVYNVENYITKCAVSLFTNSMANECEYLFVNDCSTDSSLEVLTKICSDYNFLDITILTNDKNQGVAYTRNVLLEKAHGEYIVFVDSDDWVEPLFIEKLYKTAKKDDCDVVGCWRYESYSNKEYPNADNFLNTGLLNLQNLLNGSIYNCLHCRIFKKEIIDTNKIQFIVGNNMGEDALFCVKLFSVSIKTALVKDYLYHYVHYNNNSLCNNNNEAAWEQRFNNVIEIIKYLNSISCTLQEDILLFKARFLLLAVISNSKFIRLTYGNCFPEAVNYMYKIASSKSAKIYIWCYLHKMYFLCSLFRFIKNM